MQVIAVDDERISLALLVDEIHKAGPAIQIAAFQSPAEALEYAGSHSVDAAFLDIQMFGMNGIELAREMKRLQPRLNIIFTTGYSDYMKEAFGMHASGYLLKPVAAEQIKAELDNLRNPPEARPRETRIWAQCFGSFDITVDGQPLNFRYEKAKELLAYLIDRRGGSCTTREIMAALWEDERHGSYLRNVRKCLLDTLKEMQIEDIIESDWGQMRIVPDKLDCDYYRWLAGEPDGLNAWHGEYMSRYSWAEETAARLLNGDS